MNSASTMKSLLSSDVDSFATSREFVSRDEFADGIICFHLGLPEKSGHPFVRPLTAPVAGSPGHD